MIKIGIFVEGQTERIFVVKFLSEYLGEHKFSRREIQHLGSKGTKILTKRNYPNAKYFFLIFDTTGDGNVISTVKERAEKLINNEKYNYLLAMQDLFPRPRNKKQVVIESFLKMCSPYEFRNRLKLILAIMEVEAWFLADYNLFSRIDNSITPEYIKKKLNIDIVKGNPESYAHPTKIMKQIFKLADLTYQKKEKQLYKIANNIDYDFLCSDALTIKVKSLGYFIKCVDDSINES